MALLIVGLAPAAKKDKKAAQYAVIAGTVFRESGLALPGAEVTLASAPGARKLKMRAVSDSRGEFAFHVPPGAASYTVTAVAEGCKRQEKTVAVTSDERIDVFFRLEPAPK